MFLGDKKLLFFFFLTCNNVCFQASEMGIRIREMVYHKIKLNKIFSRITGKPEEQVRHQ